MKGKIVVGQVCPNCGRNVDHVLHELWESNKLRPTIQTAIKNGHRILAPFGRFTCTCGKIISVQEYGDKNGFVSCLFDSESLRQEFVDNILEDLRKKGVSPKALHQAIHKEFGHPEGTGVLLVF